MPSLSTRAVLMAVLLSVGLPALAQTEGVAWRTDLQAAQAEARQSGKLVLAHFWTETCGPCKALEKRVFNQPTVATALQAGYVPVKINANASPELAERYKVTRVPTDVVLSPEGQPVHAFVSPATPMEYVGHVSRLASAYKARIGAPYNAAVAAAPAPARNQAYAQLAAHTPAPPITPIAAEAPVKPQPPIVSPPPAATANPFATNRPAPTAPAKQQQAAAAPATSQARAAAMVQLPPGSPPLGFEGYCPVTMKSDWRWAKGDVRFGAIHQGRTYLFANAEAQKTFLANPDSFSPALSGQDAVMAVDSRQGVAGLRDYAVEFEGRFYLFASEKTLEQFWTNPAAYAKGAERVAAANLAGGSMLR